MEWQFALTQYRTFDPNRGWAKRVKQHIAVIQEAVINAVQFHLHRVKLGDLAPGHRHGLHLVAKARGKRCQSSLIAH
ncbi:hypothetical protein D9M72_607700 [compost metagenome]